MANASQILSDPRVQQALAFANAEVQKQRGTRAPQHIVKSSAFGKFLRDTYGIQNFNQEFGVPEGKNFDPFTGKLIDDVPDWMKYVIPAIGTATMGLGALGVGPLAGAMSGGGSATTTGGALTGGAGYGPAIAQSGGTAATTAGSTAESTAAAATGGGILGKLGGKIGNVLSSPDFWTMMGGGALGLWGSKMQADAAERAADQQAKAFEKAIQLQKDMYQQQRGDLAPYRAAGQGSIGKLSYLLGVPGFENGPQSVAPTPGPFDTPQVTPSAPPSGIQAPTYAQKPVTVQSSNGAGPVSFPPGTYPIPGSASSPNVKGGPPTGAQGGPYGPTSLGQMGQPMVMLMAPDGSQKQVPQSQADFFISRGAKRLA